LSRNTHPKIGSTTYPEGEGEGRRWGQVNICPEQTCEQARKGMEEQIFTWPQFLLILPGDRGPIGSNSHFGLKKKKF
jgi:hypothetical protein